MRQAGHRMNSIPTAFALALAITLSGPVAAQDSQILSKQDDIGGLYEGTFRGGLQHGIGTYRLPNGYEYSGDWVDGEIRGKGVARFPDGSVYEGDFVKGKQEGFGKIVFSDGGTYEGQWSGGVDGSFVAARVRKLTSKEEKVLLLIFLSARMHDSGPSFDKFWLDLA